MIAVVLLVCSIAFLVLGWEGLWTAEEYQYESGDLNNAQLTPSLKEGGVVEQSFYATGLRLKSIGIRIHYQDNAPEKEENLYVALKDESGKVLKQKNLPYKDMQSWVFTEIPLQAYLHPGKLYILEFSTSSEEGLVCLIGLPDRSSPLASVNGKVQDFGLAYELQYDAFLFPVFLIWLLVFCGSAFFAVCKILDHDGFCVRVKDKHPKWTLLIKIIVILIFLMMIVEIPSGAITTGFTIPAILIEIFWCSILIAILFLFINHFKAATISAGIVLFIIGLINHITLQYRGRPVVYSDITAVQTAAAVVKAYKITLDGSMLLSASFLFLLFGCSALSKDYSLKNKKQRVCVSFSSLILGLIAVLTLQSHMVISSFGFVPNVWDPTVSMMKNGFLVNFFASVTTQHVSKPTGYSEQKIESISEEFPSDSLNSLSSTVRPNIIVIMNESWTDFSLTTDLKTNKDSQPFLHSLEQDKNVRFGKLVMPVFGAGTVMSEFEFLTGATAQSYPNGAPYITYVKQGTPSLVSTVKQLGYYAVAMHPNLASNWNRDIGYKKFGFDQFLSLDDFKNVELVRSWPSDQSTYENIIRITQETPDPLFLFCVTMQNHGSYTNSEYKSEVRITYPNGDYPMAEQYLELLSESDRAFEDLVNYYSSKEEPTVILMFGDHLPALEEELYNRLFSDEDIIDRYTTPYVIWSNLGAQDFDFEAEYLSVPYLSSLLMEYSGLPTTGFYKYMQNQASTYPVISLSGSSLSEIYNIDETVQRQYEFIQYAMFSPQDGKDNIFKYCP